MLRIYRVNFQGIKVYIPDSLPYQLFEHWLSYAKLSLLSRKVGRDENLVSAMSLKLGGHES